jgi:hypothetical protein
MSVTVHTRPYNFSGFRQRTTVIEATSTEITQPGFRYKVTVTAAGNTLYTGMIPPNRSNALIFDLHEILRTLGSQTKRTATTSIHSAFYASGGGSQLPFPETYPIDSDPANCPTLAAEPVRVLIEEAWIISGVLTVNPDPYAPELVELLLFNRTAQWEEGYRPDPNPSFALATNQYLLSDRKFDTRTWQYGDLAGANRVYVPAYATDFGLLSIPYVNQTDKAALDLPSYAATQVRVVLVPDTGSNVTVNVSLGSAPNGILHLPVYPGNIQAATNAAFSAIKPSANPNWKAYIISARDAGGNAASAEYVIYNAERYNETDCRFPRVRLAWINSRGGYDYFNFIKKSERSYETERKKYQTIPGNYGLANGTSNTFGWSKQDRGIAQTTGVVSQFLTINSDWLTVGEFELLKNLATSQEVHLVERNGSHLPVIVTDTTYTTKVKDGKLYNLTMRIQFAQNYQV